MNGIEIGFSGVACVIVLSDSVLCIFIHTRLNRFENVPKFLAPCSHGSRHSIICTLM